MVHTCRGDGLLRRSPINLHGTRAYLTPKAVDKAFASTASKRPHCSISSEPSRTLGPKIPIDPAACLEPSKNGAAMATAP